MSEPSPAHPSTTDHAIEAREAEGIARMRALLDRPLSEADLRANTELFAARVETRHARLRSILVFEIGAERQIGRAHV